MIYPGDVISYVLMGVAALFFAGIGGAAYDDATAEPVLGGDYEVEVEYRSFEPRRSGSGVGVTGNGDMGVVTVSTPEKRVVITSDGRDYSPSPEVWAECREGRTAQIQIEKGKLFGIEYHRLRGCR